VTVVRSEVRPGVYHDSIVLMQLQVSLMDLPGVLDAGAVMGSPENLQILEANELLPETLSGVRAGDLVVAVKAESEDDAARALRSVEALLVRGGSEVNEDFRPRSLSSAARLSPGAGWVLVSVPGRYAAGVAREALELGRHVFLYSDNVPIAQEVVLKAEARSRGLLVMGPDCGTAIINGVGFGFANRVRRGAVGLVGAAGTGLQAVTAGIHARGAGVSQAIGTGGRDLQAEVGGVTALQGLDLLARDPETRVIVLVSKPPEPAVVGRLLAAAQRTGKPVVVNLLGYAPPAPRLGSLHFAASLGEAARLAAELLREEPESRSPASGHRAEARDFGYLRGLFSGGTLALEVLQGLRAFLEPLHSNMSIDDVLLLADPSQSEAHSILDLGADEFTVGRPHPMIDNDLRLRRIRQEAADPEVGLILLDVVLGDGAHPDPASELAPAIEAARAVRDVEFAAIVVGTEEDPQDLGEQVESLARAGARVFRDTAEALEDLARRRPRQPGVEPPPVPLDAFQSPVSAINVGVESFFDSIVDQGADALHVDWRPPAGGNERLMEILSKMGR
jgi:FdrA protein